MSRGKNHSNHMDKNNMGKSSTEKYNAVKNVEKRHENFREKVEQKGQKAEDNEMKGKETEERATEDRATENQEKRTLRQEWRLLKRGLKLAFEISPQYFIYNILFQISQILSPYFSLYLSALFINELAGQCRWERLMLLAGITLSGQFGIKAVSRLLQARRNVWQDIYFRQTEIFMFDRLHGLQYEHLENSEVTLLREKIFAVANAAGLGVAKLFWAMGQLLADIMDIAVSASLTVSIFRMTAEGSPGGFLGFVNSVYGACLLAALLIWHVFLTVKCAGIQTRQEVKAMSGLAKDNTFFMSTYEMQGEDLAVFRLNRVLTTEFERRMIRPAWMLEWSRNRMRNNTLRVAEDALVNLAVFLVTAAKAFLGVFGIGNFLLYRGTVTRFVNAVSNALWELTLLKENNEALVLLYRFLDLPDEMYHGTLAVEKRDDIDYEIEFRNVSFRYPGTEEWVLRNVNMKFKIGDKLAIVGENGSGKTTFIKLLCRLYDPTEGVILLNGIDITRYRYGEYLSLFSVVFQDYRLFQFSLAANVAGAFDYDRDRVEKCLVQAGFGDRLAGLEKGIDTVMGRDYENDGIDLSGGEEQKVALARALYKDAPFVILDEPTAALDPIAEAAVYENFQKIVAHKTAVFISHRLSSCRFCDDIIVFDKGRLVQRGGHDILAAAEGKYRQLWNAQAQYYN